MAVFSPTEEAPSSVKDNKDGSYSVTYTAPTPGDYDISVRFYGKHIPGSPFRLDVVPSADASQCRAYGPALHPNSLHIAGNPLDLFVDTTKAGMGDLQVVITGPNDSRPKVYIANEGGVYSTKWNVQEAGRYHAHIWWADQYIPGSPFKIKVSPGPNAGLVRAYGPGLEPQMDIADSSDFTVQTKDAGIGTLTIRVHGVKGAFKIQAQPLSEAEPRTLSAFYHPQKPGDYIIAIRWSGTHVPGSPFKINIKEPACVEEERKAKIKEKKEKHKMLPPNIYYSHTESSDPGPVTNGDDHIPEPTPLAEVDKKKKKRELGKVTSQPELETNWSGPVPKSTASLPSKSAPKKSSSSGGMTADQVQEEQLAMLRQRGVVQGAGSGKAMVMSGVQYRQQTQTVTTTVSSSTGGSEVREKRKKKKKF